MYEAAVKCIYIHAVVLHQKHINSIWIKRALFSRSNAFCFPPCFDLKIAMGLMFSICKYPAFPYMENDATMVCSVYSNGNTRKVWLSCNEFGLLVTSACVHIFEGRRMHKMQWKNFQFSKEMNYPATYTLSRNAQI